MKLTESELRHIVKKVIKESLSELQLYHGTQADFDTFDTAYLSTGWGQQAHGYGFYLTDSYEAAKEYSAGGQVMLVEVPEGKYLSDKSISTKEKQVITSNFFKFYTQEYVPESYPDEETRKMCWEYEVKCLLNCTSGDEIYGTIASLLGDNKETADYLHDKLNYKGIKIHTKHGETNKVLTTYVIFNPNDIKILKKNV